MKIQKPVTATVKKAPTGIQGFDEITNGGLPSGRSTLLEGGPGSGKTMFALQFLLQGITKFKEPGIFIAFEEAPERIIVNFNAFGWNLSDIDSDSLFLLDAQPTTDMVQSGEFDLSGMLAVIQAKAKQMGAQRIVFDALDIVLALLPDESARKREVYRLHEWLLGSGLTGLITAKAADDGNFSTSREPLGFMQFMVDCSVIFNHRVLLGVSQRNLRVRKYRGSGFDENEAPFVIGKQGFDVAKARTFGRADRAVSTERISSGVKTLDAMLGGGIYRGGSVLITGLSGTSKTTLSGAFAAESCKRGDRTMFFSFESDAREVIRNLASVGIRLEPYVDSGLLKLISARTTSGTAETMLVHIKTLATEHETKCLVVDPISSLATVGNELTAHGLAERLIDFSKSGSITLLCTSMLDELNSDSQLTTPLQISTFTDTWIHLSYLVQAGERNRGLSIIKSRGTSHSNKVQELLLTDSGVTLADAYTADGEVLMGTRRAEHEAAERQKKLAQLTAERLTILNLEAEATTLTARSKALQNEIDAKRRETEIALLPTASRSGDLAPVEPSEFNPPSHDLVVGEGGRVH